MNQEKFINSYVELLNTTLTEAIQKNIVLQVQKKIAESEISGIQDKLKNEFHLELEKNKAVQNYNLELEKTISILKSELDESVKQKNILSAELAESKKAASHVDTFKNELVKTKNDTVLITEELNKKTKEFETLIKSNSDSSAKINSLNSII